MAVSVLEGKRSCKKSPEGKMACKALIRQDRGTQPHNHPAKVRGMCVGMIITSAVQSQTFPGQQSQDLNPSLSGSDQTALPDTVYPGKAVIRRPESTGLTHEYVNSMNHLASTRQ